jgi:hypothetical protein
MSRDEVVRRLRELEEKYPLVLHTRAGRPFSKVRRMKAERESKITVHDRTGFAIYAAIGRSAKEMKQPEWEESFTGLCDEHRRDFPGLHAQLFPST